MQASVHRFTMRDPGDVSQIREAIERGDINARDVVAVIGKTEGNGGVNDFTRAYFTQSLMLLLAKHRDANPDELIKSVPCVFSGGTEGVLSPHYMVFSRTSSINGIGHTNASLAVGTAFSPPVPIEHIGRAEHIESIVQAVRASMADAQIEHPGDVHFVQVKVPCVTAARAAQAIAVGKQLITSNAGQSMALGRACGAFGVGIALGDIPAERATEAALLQDRSLYCSRASVSAGVEVDCNEVIVLGNSKRWSGPLRVGHRGMHDALDIGAVFGVLADLDIVARPQVAASDLSRIAGVLVKCEPDRHGRVRQNRHTMLDDTDIDPQRHIRGAVGGLVAGVLGDGRVFVSGGAEHQGPDGGGLIAVVARSE